VCVPKIMIISSSCFKVMEENLQQTLLGHMVVVVVVVVVVNVVVLTPGRPCQQVGFVLLSVEETLQFGSERSSGQKTKTTPLYTELHTFIMHTCHTHRRSYCMDSYS